MPAKKRKVAQIDRNDANDGAEVVEERIVETLLSSMGVEKYDEAVVHHLVESMHSMPPLEPLHISQSHRLHGKHIEGCL